MKGIAKAQHIPSHQFPYQIIRPAETLIFIQLCIMCCVNDKTRLYPIAEPAFKRSEYWRAKLIFLNGSNRSEAVEKPCKRRNLRRRNTNSN